MAKKAKQESGDEESVMIHIRINLTEKDLFEKAAASDDRSLSNWARIQLRKAAEDQLKSAK